MKNVFENTPQIEIEAVDGYQEIEIKDCTNCSVRLHIDKHRRAQMFMTYTGRQTDISFFMDVEDGAHLEMLCWNRVEQKVAIHQEIQVGKDAFVHLGYGDLDCQESTYTIHVKQAHRGSEVLLTSASIALNKKFNVEMCHEAPYTKGDMHHYALVKEDGKYQMEASGIIKKGAYASVSHQATRVLTMSDKQTAEVKPVLLIDENDVKASHATTLGQPDAHQLYYLQSRGLTRQQALALLTIGYLLPICEVIKNEELQTSLQSEIEEKVIKHV